MSEHTPGPWRVDLEVDTSFMDLHGCVVARNRYGGGYIVCPLSVGTSDADARLIAAAPELLEALEVVAARRDRINEAFGYEFVGEYVDRAIVKAKEGA